MKLIKLGLISGIVLFLIATGIGMLLPSSLTISRATDIFLPKANILPYVQDASKWPMWMEGLTDTAVSKKQTDKNTWQIGKIAVQIVSADTSAIVTNWVLNGENNKATFNLIYQSPTVTTVQWSFEQRFGWLPWEKFSSMFAEKAIGVGMERSLDNLKKLVELPTPGN